MQSLAEDVTDTQSQKAAVVFLRHCVNAWGRAEEGPGTGLPGFERFIYERLVPTAFRVPWLPQFNPKDGQAIVVRFDSS